MIQKFKDSMPIITSLVLNWRWIDLKLNPLPLKFVIQIFDLTPIMDQVAFYPLNFYTLNNFRLLHQSNMSNQSSSCSKTFQKLVLESNF